MAQDNTRKSTWLPSWLMWTFQLWGVSVNIVGLMAMADNRIYWESYFYRMVSFYRQAVSQPVTEFFDYLSWNFNLDLSWIPPWFADYLPVSSIFTLGLVAAYAHLQNTTPFHLAYDFFRDMFVDLRNNFGETIYSLLFIMAFMFIFALTSPFFVIVFPAMLVVLFGGMIIWGLVFWAALIRFFVVMVLPWVVLAAALVVGAWLLISRDSFLRFWSKGKNFLFGRVRRAAKVAPAKLSEAYTHVRKAIPEAGREFSKSLSFFLRLILVQYGIALVIILAFLTAVTINNTLSS